MAAALHQIISSALDEQKTAVQPAQHADVKQRVANIEHTSEFGVSQQGHPQLPGVVAAMYATRQAHGQACKIFITSCTCNDDGTNVSVEFVLFNEAQGVLV
jgi:hypothetical protein